MQPICTCYHSNLTFDFNPYLKLAGGGRGSLNHPLGFFSLKFLPLDQLLNDFAQLFLDNEDIFCHSLDDVSINDVIILIDGKWSLLSNF